MQEDKTRAKLLTALITILTVGITAALGIGGILLYVRGKAAVRAGAAEYIFSRSVAAAFLKPFLIPAIILILLIVLAAVLKVRAEETKPYLDKNTAAEPKRKMSVSAYSGLGKRDYIVVFGLAAVLIAAGAANGGIRDVLIKAINICTECIGLG